MAKITKRIEIVIVDDSELHRVTTMRTIEGLSTLELVGLLHVELEAIYADMAQTRIKEVVPDGLSEDQQP